jgi:hypothetical protein
MPSPRSSEAQRALSPPLQIKELFAAAARTRPVLRVRGVLVAPAVALCRRFPGRS